jgi:hypothetical protein
MIYVWFTGINYYKLAVEKDHDPILRPYGDQGPVVQKPVNFNPGLALTLG